MRLRAHLGSGGNVHDSAGREDSSAAHAEDARFKDWRGFIIDPAVNAGFGSTRRRSDGNAGGLKVRGNSKLHQRHAGGCDPRKLGDPSDGESRESEGRG